MQQGCEWMVFTAIEFHSIPMCSNENFWFKYWLNFWMFHFVIWQRQHFRRSFCRANLDYKVLQLLECRRCPQIAAHNDSSPCDMSFWLRPSIDVTCRHIGTPTNCRLYLNLYAPTHRLDMSAYKKGAFLLLNLQYRGITRKGPVENNTLYNITYLMIVQNATYRILG